MFSVRFPYGNSGTLKTPIISADFLQRPSMLPSKSIWEAIAMRRQGLWTWISAAAVTGIVTATAGKSLGQVNRFGPQENCNAYLAAPSSGGGCMLTSSHRSIQGAATITVDWTKGSNQCTGFSPQPPVTSQMSPAVSVNRQVSCVPDGARLTLRNGARSCSVLLTNKTTCLKLPKSTSSNNCATCN